jgi:hypothetical protein
LTWQGAAARLAGLALAVIVGFGPIQRLRAALAVDVRLTGAVGDLASGAPIPGALVTAGPWQTWTGPGGEFSFVVSPGKYDVRATAPGYVGATWVGVDAGDGQSLAVGLPPEDPREEDMAALAAAVRGPELPADPAGETGNDVWMDQASGVNEVPPEIRVLMPDGSIVPMETDEYLKGVVPAEMGYVFRRAAEALKAQAIASRTYASRGCIRDSAGDPQVCEPGLDANVDTTTRTQVWRPVHYDVSDQAVDETHGYALRFDDTLIPSLYFARTHEWTVASADGRCCGGRPWPFLQAESSPEAFSALYGHGSGMSQEGTATFADWGARAESILEHYYQDAEVVFAARPGRTQPDQQGPEEGAGRTDAPSQASIGASATVKAAEVHIPADSFDIPPGMPASKKAKGIVVDGPRPAVVEGPVVGAEFPFTAIGASVRASLPADTQLQLDVRASRDGVEWSPWLPLEFESEDAKEPEPVGTKWTGLAITRGRFLQARVALHPSAAGSPTLEDVTLHTLNSDAGPDAPIHAKGGTEVISRSRWGADESLRLDAEGNEIWPPEYTTPRAEIVHHTVTANGPADPAAIVRAVYHYHAVSRGWGDIGYNFLVDDRGNVYEGRYGGERDGKITQGGHALQFNTNTIGVALLGTYTSAADQPPPAMVDALEELLAIKAARYGIAPSSPVVLADVRFPYGVLGHRDVLPGHTACPGDGVAALLPEIRTQVEVRVGDVPPPTQAPPTQDPPTSPPPTDQNPATAPATRPPPAADCTELVVGGDFEVDAPGWTRSRAYRTSYDAYSGQYSLFVGLTYQDPDEQQSWARASVPVRIPERLTSARLSYAAKTYGGANDQRLIGVVDAAGTVLPGSQTDLPPGLPWTEFTADVTDALAGAAGSDARLEFEVKNSGDGDKSHLRVDDVSLVACAGGEPAPTATPRATAAPSATPAPTAQPVVACGNLLEGGSFENGLAGWHASGNLEVAADSSVSAEGAAALRLGTADGPFGYAAVEQLLRVPGRTITATLRLAVRGSTAPGTVVAELRRPGAGERLVLARILPEQQAPDWQRYSAVLPPDRVDNGTLLLSGLSAGAGMGPSWADDIRVEACWLAAWTVHAPAAANRPGP